MVTIPQILAHMFPNAVARIDYDLAQDNAGAINIIKWNAVKLGQQPTEAAIEAARPAAETAEAQAEADRAADEQMRQQAKAAWSDLQQILDAGTLANLVQVSAALRTLARVEQHLIRGLLGR